MAVNNKFAKVFEFRNHQVLVTKEAEDEDYYTLKEQLDHNYTNYSATTFFSSVKSRDMAFARYSQKDAEKYLNEVSKEIKL